MYKLIIKMSFVTLHNEFVNSDQVLSTKSKKSFRPNIKWQYSVPSGRRDFGKGSRQFIWDTRLGPCSTSCSGGKHSILVLNVTTH